MPVNAPLSVDASHLRRLCAYHHWAGDQLFDAAASLSRQDLDAEWGGSFKTGRGLVAHIIGAERIWAERWAGRFAATRPEFPASHSGADFQVEWRRVRDDQRRFVDQLAQDALARELTYKNVLGQTKTFSIADILLHVVNHGTYHRGQLAQLLRDRGQKAPSTDMLLYFDAEQR